MKHPTFLLFACLFIAQFSIAQDNPLWLRYPAISPDGSTIVFSYKGDLWRVDATGGLAYPLTLHEAHDYMPVWSRDGQQIAFASDRYGNYDVFVMAARGGNVRRLTYHSADDHPSDFTPDGQRVLFASSRLDAASNQQFPSGVLPELYSTPVSGGRVRQELTTPAEWTRYNSAGTMLVFHDRKGYEDPMRKHHTSSVTRDVWLYDLESATYTQFSSFEGEDRNPVFVPGQEAVYYLSERAGDFNVFRQSIYTDEAIEQLTSFEKHPVRHLSVSDNGLLCFSWNGELYTLRPGQEPRKVSVQTMASDRYNEREILPVNAKITDMALSPNGKEVAFVVRGEVFVASVKEGTTRRITETPEQERSVSFHPDGRKLIYAGERDGSWNVYEMAIVRDEEPYFFMATLLEEKALVNSEKEEFQPRYSPDGEEVAYLEERTELRVINLKSKDQRTILPGDLNYSYSDGDQHYQWSPDGQWFLVEYLANNVWIQQAGLVKANGVGEVINLTKSGYSDAQPRWMMDGQMMMWYSDRDGQKNHGSWGGEGDIYGMFFTRAAYDRFQLDEEAYAIWKEEKEKKEKANDQEEDDDDEDEKAMEPLEIELDGIEDRKTKLTIHSSDLGGAYVDKAGENLYYLAKFEKGYDLWKTELRSKDTKILAKLGAKSVSDMQVDEKEEHLFVLADGKIHKIEIKEGKAEPVKINGEMVLNAAAERAYLLEHIWRQVEKKFYLPDLHSVDWGFYKEAYQRFLPHINNGHDFAEMLSELLGELNASHTGARYRPEIKAGDETAALGLFYNQQHTGDGWKVVEVMAKGPFDKSESEMRPGVIIEKIDGKALSTDVNPYALLNRKKGKPTLVSLYDPATQKRWDERVEPISLDEENQLRYQRWVDNCRELVDSLSGGNIGYVHVRGMNDKSYRTVYEEVLGRNASKEALIVDTRFNGGGWLHDDLATFLSGEQYIRFRPRGQELGAEPQFKWRKPSIVVMSESNYSDAHMFPFAYKELGIGKLLGMPVPGTGTAVWWERLPTGDLVFGIPQVGMLTNDDKYLENNQLEPDVKVPNDPGLVARGRDQQLEAAVKELQQQLKKAKP